MARSWMRSAGALAAVFALLGPSRAHADYQPMLHLLPEGAVPTLQLMPELLEAKKKKKAKKPAPAPAPDAPDVASPDLSGATTDSPGSTAPVAVPAPSSRPVRAGSSVPALRDVPAAVDSNGPPPNGADMNFDLLGDSKPRERTSAELAVARTAELRRTTLTIHQTVGLATLSLLAATVVVGQLNYADKFASHAPNNTARYEGAHTILAYGTLGGFAATGLLGLFAPVAYDKPVHADTTLAHKLCMGAATLGMMTEMGLGIYTASHEGFANQKSAAQAHQIIGISTLAFMGAGASAFLF